MSNQTPKVFRKLAVKSGVYHQTFIDPITEDVHRTTVYISPEYLRKSAWSTMQMKRRNLEVPVCLDHKDDAYPRPVEQWLENEMRSSVGKLIDVQYNPKEQSHEYRFEINDPDIARKIDQGIITKVSPNFHASFSPGDGTVWKNVVGHLALTFRPKDYHQSAAPMATVSVDRSGQKRFSVLSVDCDTVVKIVPMHKLPFSVLASMVKPNGKGLRFSSVDYDFDFKSKPEFYRWLSRRYRQTLRMSVSGKQGHILYFAVIHAPAGGVVVNGKKYLGGQFIPNAHVEGLPTADRDKLRAASAEWSKKRAETARKYISDSESDKQAVARHAGEHANAEITPEDKKAAMRRWASLRGYHGEHALRQVAVLAGKESAQLATLDPNSAKAAHIRRRLRAYHEMAQMVKMPEAQPMKAAASVVGQSNQGPPDLSHIYGDRMKEQYKGWKFQDEVNHKNALAEMNDAASDVSEAQKAAAEKTMEHKVKNIKEFKHLPPHIQERVTDIAKAFDSNKSASDIDHDLALAEIAGEVYDAYDYSGLEEQEKPTDWVDEHRNKTRKQIRDEHYAKTKNLAPKPSAPAESIMTKPADTRRPSYKKGPIKSNDPNAAADLQRKHDGLSAWHERSKKANAMEPESLPGSASNPADEGIKRRQEMADKIHEHYSKQLKDGIFHGRPQGAATAIGDLEDGERAHLAKLLVEKGILPEWYARKKKIVPAEMLDEIESYARDTWKNAQIDNTDPFKEKTTPKFGNKENRASADAQSSPIVSPVNKRTSDILSKPKSKKTSYLDSIIAENQKEAMIDPAKKDSPADASSKKPKGIMAQAKAYKDKYPEHIVLHRMGDFYESFGEDADKLASELKLTKTTRDKELPMAGFPHHALESHMQNLISKGHKVAIVDGDNERKVEPEDGSNWANSGSSDWREAMKGKPRWQAVEHLRNREPHELTFDEYHNIKTWDGLDSGKDDAEFQEGGYDRLIGRSEESSNYTQWLRDKWEKHRDDAYMAGKEVAEKPHWAMSREEYKDKVGNDDFEYDRMIARAEKQGKKLSGVDSAARAEESAVKAKKVEEMAKAEPDPIKRSVIWGQHHYGDPKGDDHMASIKAEKERINTQYEEAANNVSKADEEVRRLDRRYVSPNDPKYIKAEKKREAAKKAAAELQDKYREITKELTNSQTAKAMHDPSVPDYVKHAWMKQAGAGKGGVDQWGRENPQLKKEIMEYAKKDAIAAGYPEAAEHIAHEVSTYPRPDDHAKSVQYGVNRYLNEKKASDLLEDIKRMPGYDDLEDHQKENLQIYHRDKGRDYPEKVRQRAQEYIEERQAEIFAEKKMAEDKKAAKKEHEETLKSIGHIRRGEHDKVTPEVARRVMEHAVKSGKDWHANPVKEAHGKPIKQQDYLNESMQRYSSNATLAETGFWTDGKALVRGTDDMREKARQIGSTGRSVGAGVNQMISDAEKRGLYPAKVMSKDGRYGFMARDERNKPYFAVVPHESHNRIVSLHPDATPHIGPKSKGTSANTVVYKNSAGEVVGLAMPLVDKSGNPMPIPEQFHERVDPSELFEPGPHAPKAMQEVNAGSKAIRVYHPDAKAHLLVKPGDDKEFVIEGYHGEYPTKAQALKRAREILSYAHGKDDDGNLIFKPKKDRIGQKSVMEFGVVHAPAGGIDVHGHHYLGGQFTPGDASGAKSEQKASAPAVEQKRSFYRKADGHAKNLKLKPMVAVAPGIGKVNGYKHGNMIIHKNGDRWQITHAPTGKRIGASTYKDDAIRKAYLLHHGLDWNFAGEADPVHTARFKDVAKGNIPRDLDEGALHPAGNIPDSHQDQSGFMESWMKYKPNYEESKKKYIATHGTFDENGNLKSIVANIDHWRDYIPGYNGTNAYQTHPAAKYANEKFLDEIMEEMKGKGNGKIAILGGGGGSGKGTAVASHFDEREYPIRLDQTSSDYDSLMSRINDMKAKGYEPDIVFVDRRPREAWQGVVGRAGSLMEQGQPPRTVPKKIAIQANIDARKVALRLAQENPDIPLRVIDNHNGYSNSRLLKNRDEIISHLKNQEYNIDEELKEADAHVERLQKQGKLPEHVAAALR